MTTREMLHAIVDELPESDLVTAVRILRGLEVSPAPLQIALANAPLDDEPDDEDFDSGFALAETLINFSTSLSSLGHVAPGNWIYNLTTIAVLQPLMQGSATGMIVATVWRQRLGKLGGREIGGVAMAVLAHIAFSGGTQILSDTGVSPLFIRGEWYF